MIARATLTVGFVLLVMPHALPASSEHDTSGDGLVCWDHPCSDLAYEVVYEEEGGRIISLSWYDPCGPPWYDCAASRPVTAGLAPGQGWVNLVDHPLVASVVAYPPAFRIDPETLEPVQVEPIPSSVLNRSAESLEGENAESDPETGTDGDALVSGPSILLIMPLVVLGIISIVAMGAIWRSSD